MILLRIFLLLCVATISVGLRYSSIPKSDRNVLKSQFSKFTTAVAFVIPVLLNHNDMARALDMNSALGDFATNQTFTRIDPEDAVNIKPNLENYLAQQKIDDDGGT